MVLTQFFHDRQFALQAGDRYSGDFVIKTGATAPSNIEYNSAVVDSEQNGERTASEGAHFKVKIKDNI